YARHFGSRRIIHRHALAAQADAEVVLEGVEPVELADGFLAIPTPGHTRGHMVLLRENYLFAGDHLWWDREEQRLDASRDYCWYRWEEQIESMRRLLAYSFTWVLPGHGERIHLPAERMQTELQALVARMPGQEWQRPTSGTGSESRADTGRSSGPGLLRHVRWHHAHSFLHLLQSYVRRADDDLA